MVLTLFAITLIGSAAVGVVYKVTLEPIAEAKAGKTRASLAKVLPSFDSSSPDSLKVDGGNVVVYTARSGEHVVGYAVETFTNNGFNGLIRLMVGFLPDGTIHRIEVLEHGETPGLGDKIDGKKSSFSVQFEGKNPASFNLAVKKNGGDVDAITASTISSSAFSDAVSRAYRVFGEIEKQ